MEYPIRTLKSLSFNEERTGHISTEHIVAQPTDRKQTSFYSRHRRFVKISQVQGRTTSYASFQAAL